MAVSGRKTEKYMSSASIGSGPDYAHSCDACLVDEQDVEAIGYCVECKDYLCVTCYRSHRKSRASRDHQLIDNTSFLPVNITTLTTDVITEKCSVHGGETLKFFCPKHETLGCSDCMTLKHRVCKIDYIPDKCSGLIKSKEFKDTLQKLGSLREDIKSVEKLATNRRSELDIVHKRVVDDINKFQTDLNDRICQLRKLVINEADRFKQAEENKIADVLKKCEQMESDVNLVQSSAQEYEAAGQDGQAFISIERAKQLIKFKDVKLTEAPYKEINTLLAFQRNKDIEHVFSGQTVFGKLHTTEFKDAAGQIGMTSFTPGMQTFASENPVWTKEAGYRSTGAQKDSDKTNDDETDTIEVRKFSEDCSDDSLQVYFENQKRSGGGEIASFNLQRDKGYAHITFKDKSVVIRVVAQKQHIVEQCELTVSPLIISKTELLLDKVPDTVTKEHLSNFVEARFKVRVVRVVFSQDRSKCLVQSSERFDFSKAKEACKKFKIGGRHIIPCQIPVTTGIIITMLPQCITHEEVEAYFENTRRSQGGDTLNVELKAKYGYCLVFFKDAKVAVRVCKHLGHQLHGQFVNVEPYNDYLSLP